MQRIEFTIAPHPAAHQDARLMAPQGLATPEGTARLEQAGTAHACESGNVLIEVPTGDAPVTLTYALTSDTAPYPEAMFTPRDSRFTRAAEALVEDALALAGAADPALAIANHVAQLFTYGHPDTRFYDAHDELPQLCGLTEGSCVDINAYLIASFRAAGIAAGYLYGVFFPAEKTNPDGSACANDGHCWVVTRDGFGIREWDIAHHLKMGTRDIAPARDPRGGQRFALSHSMGLSFPSLGIADLKLMGEPMWFMGHRFEEAGPVIRLTPASAPAQMPA